jgi:hypothetical protein
MELSSGINLLIDIFLRLEVEGRESWLGQVSKANERARRAARD